MPFIQARIRNFLSESMRVTEFSHTILHKQVNALVLAEWLNMNNRK